jgi:Ca2+/Na+ antiporter
MENAIDHMLNDPMFWKITLVIVVLILVASFKKLFKLAMVLGLIIVVYALYLVFTGQDPESIIEDLNDAAVEYIQEPDIQFEEPDINIDEGRSQTGASPPAKEPAKPKKSRKKKKSDADILKEFEDEEKRIMDEFEEEERRIMEEFKSPEF